MLRSPYAVLLVALSGGPSAIAGTLKGTLVFPPPPRTAADLRPLANWRIENGQLPIAAPPAEPRRDVVVALEPERALPPRAEGTQPPAVALEARPLRLEPRVSVGEVGATFSIKNADRAA